MANLDEMRARVEAHPDSAEAHAALGQALLRSDGDAREAEAHLATATALDPTRAAAWSDLGLARSRLQDLSGALAAFDAASRHAPTSPIPWANRAAVLRAFGQPDAAADALTRALALDPDNPTLHASLGETTLHLGDLPGALAAFQRALDLEPDHPTAVFRAAWIARKLCDWDALQALDPRLAAHTRSALASGRVPAEDPWTHLGRLDDPDENLAVARAWSDRIHARSGAGPGLRPPRRPGDRLRIGYLSSDWYHHATPQLLVAVLEAHDRDAVEVVAYSHGHAADSPMTRRVHAAVDRLVDITPLSDEAAARRIADDGIDVLVDLKGFTRGHRLGVMAWRPAPVTATWLGHPGTTGARFIDFAIVDDTVVPPDRVPQYTERLAYLPCYQPNDPRRPVPPPMPRAAARLPEDAVILASFNDPWKIDAATFDRWCQILRAVPEAILWVLVRHPAAIERMRQRAGDIAPERIRGAVRLPWVAHLARIQAADLGLDTVRVNGHTTTSELLWAGVPVVSHGAGAGLAARVSASLLRRVGLPELVASDPDAMVEAAIALARDRRALARLRQRLQAGRRTAPLWDARRFARDLEALFRRMLDAPPGRDPVRVADPPPG